MISLIKLVIGFIIFASGTYGQDICSGVVCQNGGTCFVASDQSASTPYICHCSPQFGGLHCETRQADGSEDICSGDACQNGGTCFIAFDQSTSRPYICNCPPEFEGLHCEIQTQQTPTVTSGPDLCSSSPCLNGATCVNPSDPMSTTVHCHCARGFLGYFCDREDTGTGDCDPNPCANGGICDPTPFAVQGFTCECQHGYRGDRCEESTSAGYDGCASSPCQNGAQCFIQYDENKYFCNCAPGYVGRHCETEDPCVSEPCTNGGTCLEESMSPSGYRCICSPQFYGANCTQEYKTNPCEPNPCDNNAPCFRLMETVTNGNAAPFYCACQPGFMGTTCQMQDPCFSAPCVNGGSCTQIAPGGSEDLVQGYWCYCPDDFTGPTCSEPGPCSSNPCLNGGVCANIQSVEDPVFEEEETSYVCSCQPGWTGMHCGTSLTAGDLCASNPCINGGTCQVSGPFYSCECPTQYVGDICQYRDPCLSNPCANGGQCYVSWTGGSYLCQCSDIFIGQRCEITATACLSAPCQNGGTCKYDPDTNSYDCQCPDGFLGRDCQLSDPCFPMPCQNNGECWRNAESTDFICRCGPGYSGNLCQIRAHTEPTPTLQTSNTDPQIPDHCSSNPCSSVSTCVTEGPDHSGNYFAMCLCPLDYTGVTCAVRLPPTIHCQPNPCLNGGTCFSTFTSFDEIVCSCSEGYTGYRCQTDMTQGATPDQPTSIDYRHISTTRSSALTDLSTPCTSNPCLNEGTCVDNHSIYVCLCPTFFVGDRCEMDIRDCSFGGKSFIEGDKRNEGCGECVCQNGEWHCTSSTCECHIGASVYMNNETWMEDCNTCACHDGVSVCTNMDCSTVCVFEGRVFDIGTQRDDRCTTCICQFGRWYCAAIDDCVDNSCTYGETAHEEWSIRPQTCNLCTCEDRHWHCTDRSCDEYPTLFEITIKFLGDAYVPYDQQEQFTSAIKTYISNLYHLGEEQIQEIEVTPGTSEGRFRLQFTLVKNSTQDISVKVVSEFIENSVTDEQFVIDYNDQTYVADPSSFKAKRIVIEVEPTPLPSSSSLNISRVIIGSVGGVAGICIILSFIAIFVCCHTKRNSAKEGDTSAPLDMQQFAGQFESPPDSPVSLVERSLSVPAHYRFKNPFTNYIQP